MGPPGPESAARSGGKGSLATHREPRADDAEGRLLGAFEEGRNPLSDPDAQRGEPELGPPRLHGVGERARNPRAGAADGVAEGDRSTPDVHPGGVELERTDAGEGLDGEGLVQLDEIEVGDAGAGAGEELA